MSIHTKRGSTRKFAAAVAVALVASVLALATPVGAKQSVSTARVSGADRYLTSTALSAAASLAGADSTDFVLVNGTSYADALSAAALAGTKQGTIILLPADGTISASATARMAIGANITIVGGYSALPATVETTMKTLRPLATITRISGADRYATAAAVAQNITSANVAAVNGLKSAFLASGTSFADAVIAAPGAYAGPNNSAATAVVPIMLTATDALSAPTSAQMSLLGIKQVFVLGGTAVVSAAVEASVTALGMTVIRLSGANRYATATAIADRFTTLTTAGGWGFDDGNIGLVNIEQSGGGADALAAAAYLGQLKAPALGAGASGLATETSTWLTAHNGATGVTSIKAIGGTAAVSAAQLTAADAAGTIAGPVATITASPGQSAVTINFSQTVTSTSASLTTNYQIMGAATLAAVTAVTYTTALNRITLTLDNPLKTGDIVRINAGGIKTAASLSVGLTDVTVGYDLVKPTCTAYAATGTVTIVITCDELIQVADSGTLNTLVDGIYVGGVALTASGAIASKVLTVTEGQNWTATGAAIVIPKDIFEDLAGNNNAAISGSVVTDTTKATVVGLPTYTVTHLTKAVIHLGAAAGRAMFEAVTAGIGGNSIKIITVDDNRAAATAAVTVGVASGITTITITSDDDGSGASAGPITNTICTAINTHATAKSLVLCRPSGTTQAGSAVWPAVDLSTATALAGGTSRLTVTTTFSEPVTVAGLGDVEYDVGGNNAGQVDAATNTVIGSTLTSTWTLDGTAHLTAPTGNVDTIHYDLAGDGGINDRAANVSVAAEKALASP